MSTTRLVRAVVALAVTATVVTIGWQPAGAGNGKGNAHGQAKVTVCHVDDDGVVTAKLVPEPAVQAHLDHGDALPGDPVPAQPDAVYDENCEPEIVIVDTDGDGVPDDGDNCPDHPNADQADNYGGPDGDACEDLDGDGTLDVDESSFCLSVDGVAVVPARGGTVCSTTPSTGAEPNVAVANGFDARALAQNGSGNEATAIGDSTRALAYNGNGNTASALFEQSYAEARGGDDNEAVATNEGATALVFDGSRNRAEANGPIAFARSGSGDDNTAITNGYDASAIAGGGDGNFAQADTDFCIAEAFGTGQTDTC